MQVVESCRALGGVGNSASSRIQDPYAVPMSGGGFLLTQPSELVFPQTLTEGRGKGIQDMIVNARRNEQR